MFGIKKFLFGSGPANLPEDIVAALDVWRETAPPVLDEAHFHVRYIVIDIVSTGLDPVTDQLLGIAAAGVEQAGLVRPDDAFYLDFSALQGDAAALDRQLMAFLRFVAKAPLVTYHVPYVGGFLHRVYKEHLGIDFAPHWVDLAWLLPSLFSEKSHTLQALDQWLDLFGLGGESGRRDGMTNTLLLARIFQMLLVRANGKAIDTAAKLVDESRASSFLRRTH